MMVRIKILVLLAVIGFASCNLNNDNKPIDSIIIHDTIIQIDTTPKVTGIGGIFFKSENPDELNNWYSTNLGIAIGEYGAPFEFRNANRPEEINYLNWGVFNSQTDYFLPSEKEFMINYRVQNIEGLLRLFKENGVEVIGEIQDYEYGRFLYIMDPDGNKIELWEPIDSILTEFGGETNK